MANAHVVLRPASCILLALCTSSCGTAERDEDAQKVWDTSHTQLHTVHAEGILAMADSVPATYTYPCADGGTIEMTVAFEGEPIRDNISALLHVFKDCNSSGLILNGPLDYADFSLCDSGLPSFEVRGNLVASGEFDKECALTGRETCGSLVGRACGFPVD